jgi:hypothetical protein
LLVPGLAFEYCTFLFKFTKKDASHNSCFQWFIKSLRLCIVIDLRMETSRFVILLLKSSCASTSNCNVSRKYHHWTSKFIEMDITKQSNSKKCLIERGSITGTWYWKVTLWSHFSKMASNTPTFGNFWASLKTRDWFHCLS